MRVGGRVSYRRSVGTAQLPISASDPRWRAYSQPIRRSQRNFRPCLMNSPEITRFAAAPPPKAKKEIKYTNYIGSHLKVRKLWENPDSPERRKIRASGNAWSTIVAALVPLVRCTLFAGADDARECAALQRCQGRAQATRAVESSRGQCLTALLCGWQTTRVVPFVVFSLVIYRLCT